jgi:TM2 domain-containing membrane protein YozV
LAYRLVVNRRCARPVQPIVRSTWWRGGPTFRSVTYDPNQPGYTNPIDGYPTEQSPYPQSYMQPGYGPIPDGMNYGTDIYGRPMSDRSKVVAGLLGILLGGFGAGRFYMGDTKTGILMLVVTVFTCGLGHLWGVVDGILILVNGGVDAQGRVLRD